MATWTDSTTIVFDFDSIGASGITQYLEQFIWSENTTIVFDFNDLNYTAAWNSKSLLFFWKESSYNVADFSNIVYTTTFSYHPSIYFISWNEKSFDYNKIKNIWKTM